jgi:drug/metabolite transporter (DMT)-like permease
LRREALRADVLLLLVAAIWGSGFVAQRAAWDAMGALTFNALRYGLGFVLLGVVVVGRGRWRATRRELWGGVVLGAVMAVAAWLQQAGLETTTAARAGFFTGLYVLVVPVIGLAFGERVRAGHVAGAVLAVGGLWLLSGDVSGGIGRGIGRGDQLVLGCAVLWGLHVVLTGRLAAQSDALRLAAIQFAVVAVASGLLAVALEHDRFATVHQGWLPVLYSGMLVIALAFTLQIVAQRTAPPTHAAVLMSLEAVFGAAFGMLLLAERLGSKEAWGCALMLGGCIVSQIWPRKRTASERAELRDAVR